ncbi:MAG TPA: Gfo/Idh/MocA family oxidoreductase [Acidimicrobiia bacterium]
MTGVAVVGAGHWGPHLVRNFNDHLSSQVLWVVDTDEVRRRAIGERFPTVALTDSIEDALADARVDAVVIATPTKTHADLAGRALRSGKHVLVEKPLAHSIDAARGLVGLADENDLVLMVGHVFLFNPAYQAAKELIDEGHLGRVRYLSMVRTNLGPVRVDVNAGWDLASHDISIANHWLNAQPVEVSATGGSWLNDGVQDVVFASFLYPEGQMVHIEASWLNPRKRRLASVVGSERMLTVDDMDLNEPLRIYDKGVVESGSERIADTFAGFRAQIREGEVRIPHVVAGEPLKRECEAFLDRVAGKPDALSDGWTGLRVVAALEAIDRSIAAGGAAVPVEEIA